MRLNGRDNFNIAPKSFTSTIPSVKTKKKNDVQRENEHPRSTSRGAQKQSIKTQIKKMGPICKTGKKADAVFPQSSIEEDLDFDKQLDSESFSSVDDCVWLSSGCLSPSFFFEEQRLSGQFHLEVDECLVSWLSTLANSNLSLSKEFVLSKDSMLSPVEENSSTLENPAGDKTVQEGLNEEGFLLLSTPGKDSMDSSADSPGSIKSYCLDSCEDSTTCDNCSSRLSISTIGSEQISDTVSELEYFHSGFATPYWKSTNVSEVKLSPGHAEVKGELTKSNLYLEQASEVPNPGEFNVDEPLFWPYDGKFSCSSEETWKYFSMSPRKDIMNFRSTGGTSSRATTSRLHDRDLKNGSKEKLVVKSGSSLGLERRSKSNTSDKVKRTNSKPSRLIKSTKISANAVPFEMEDHVAQPKDGEFPISKSDCEVRNFWDDDFPSSEELPIEKILGLGEFDGQEGVDSGPNEGVFLLDESF